MALVADNMLYKLCEAASKKAGSYASHNREAGVRELAPMVYTSALARVEVISGNKWLGEALGYEDESVLFLGSKAAEWHTFSSIKGLVEWLNELKTDGEIESFWFRFIGTSTPSQRAH